MSIRSEYWEQDYKGGGLVTGAESRGGTPVGVCGTAMKSPRN